MSKFSFVYALSLVALLVGAGVILNAATPTEAVACSDPPCRAK